MILINWGILHLPKCLYFTVWMVYLFFIHFIRLEVFYSAVLTCFYARIVQSILLSFLLQIYYATLLTCLTGLCINKSLLFLPLNLQPPQSESAPQ